MSLVTDADLEKLLASLHRIDIKGEIKLVSSVNVAMVRTMRVCSPLALHSLLQHL